MNYDVYYFIRKFAAIPEEQWCNGAFEDGAGRYCVLGHCGMITWIDYETEEAKALQALSLAVLKRNVMVINDYEDYFYPQPTPKQRILAALRDVACAQLPDDEECA